MDALTPEERALLFHCRDHVVAFCPVCSRWFQHAELAADFFSPRPSSRLCPE